MATIAKLNVLLSLDDSGFQRSLQNTRDKLDSWGSSLRSTGTKLTAGVTTPLLASGTAFVMWASSLEQTLGATEVLWGDNADTMVAWAKSADKSMGMTQDSALQNANRFNAMFKTIGHGQDTVMDMSQGFTQLSADLSAMWGGSPDEAANALTSALRGNYEAMDKYNVNLTEAMVSQEAMNIAIADGRDEITEADKTQARYNLIMAQTTDAQGQFARETDTTAGKLAITTARLKNAATAFGRLLLPYVNKAADYVSRFVDWLDKLNDTQRAWILGIAAAAAALGPLLIVIGMILPGLSALIAVIGFLISPIGLVVIAVAALAAGLIYAYTHFEGFRNIVNAVAATIRDVAITAFDAFVRALEPVKEHVENVLDVLGSLIDFVKAVFAGDWAAAWSALKDVAENAFDALISWVTLVPSMIAAAIGTDMQGLISKGGELIGGLWDGAVSKWNEFTGWLGGLASDAASWIVDTSSSLWQKGVDLIVGLGDGAVTQWGNFTTWIAERGAMAASGIGDVLTSLWQKGVDLIVGLGEGAVTQWTNFTDWLSTRGSSSVTAIGDLIATLWQKGVDLFIGLGDGAQEQWGNLREWLSTRHSASVTAIGDLLRTLWRKGVDLFIGFGDGIQEQWGNLKTWLNGMPSRLLSAVGDLASTLWNAGWDLMWGLAQGIYAGAEDLVSAAVGSVADLIPGWIKDPLGINSPSRVFRDIGRELPAGLALGIGDGENSVKNAVGSLAHLATVGSFSTPGFQNVGTLSGYMPTIGNGSGVAPVIQIITLEPGRWQEFLADAQAGGHFARNFDGSFGMMEGVV